METFGVTSSELLKQADVTVSIIIPAFNTAKHIRVTLESVFAQTFKDFEVIVINDQSPDSDELERVLSSFREHIIYLKQENRGPAGARNTGIRQARGKYLAFLDSDDCWLPEYLAYQIRFFNDNPSVDVIYSDAHYFGDPALAGKTFMQTCPSRGPVNLESLIKGDCQVITSCSVALRQTVANAGLFDEDPRLRGCEDYDLWLRILYRSGRIRYHRSVLGRYQSRPGSLSRNAMRMSDALSAVYEKSERTMDLSEKTKTVLRRQLKRAQARYDLEAGRNFLASGQFEEAKNALRSANNFFHRANLRLAIGGLELAPCLTRFAVMVWQKFVSRWVRVGALSTRFCSRRNG